MFRKSAAILVALFGLVAANKNAPHQPKPAGPVTPYKKVQQIKMCAYYPQYVYPNSGYGAYTFPIFAGECPSGFAVGVTEFDAQTFQPLPVTGTRIGTLSGVCSGNPYGGKQYTYYRKSTGGGLIDIVGNNECSQNWCYYSPAGAPQMVNGYNFPSIPANLPANEVQALANDWCTGNGNSYAIQPDRQVSTCYGKLAIKPPATQKNKFPGSVLRYIYNTTTVYEFAGANYLIDTQYGLGGWEAASEYLTQNELYAYSVFSSISCQWVPREINTSPGHVTSGSGKFEKLPQSIVKDVQVYTGRIIPNRNPVTSFGNAYNPYQNDPIMWGTEITLEYAKLYNDWTLL